MSRSRWLRKGLLVMIGLFAATIISGALITSARWIDRPFAGFFLHENMTVAPYFLPQWSGANSSLRILDRVVQVEGRKLGSRQELYDFVKSHPPGSRFRYEIIRGEKSLEISIPSMTLSFPDWLLSFGVFLITGIAFLVIGATPFYLRSSSPAAGALFFMASAVFVWFGANFDFMTAGVLPKGIRVFALTLTPGIGIHLALLLKSGQPLRHRRPVHLVPLYGLSAVFGGLYTATFFGPVGTWIAVLQATYAYSCAAAIVFLAVIWSTLKGTLPELERSRLRVIFFGASFGFFLPTLGTVLTNSFQWAIPYNLALIPTLFFPLSVAYALLKYSLFDLGNTLKIGLSRIALTAFLLMIYVGVVFVLGLFVGIYPNEPLIPLLFSVLVVLLFNPLLRGIEGALTRYIYRHEYNPVELQKEVSLFLRSLSKAQSVADGFLTLVGSRMGIDRALLLYQLRGRDEFLTAATGQRKVGHEWLPMFLVDDRRHPFLLRQAGISRDEAANDPTLEKERETLLKIFDQSQSELLIPIIFENDIRGYVAFGGKRSGRGYSADDLRILAGLTDQLALSLENGRLFEESEMAKEEFRHLYDQAETLNKKLVEVNRLKKQFVANICHELRTPISTILGYSEVLLDPNFRGDGRSILERLANNGQDLSQLMDDLFDFSRVESGSELIHWERVRLKEVLGSLEVMIQRLIREKPISFRVQIETSVDYIESDAQKLQRILMQLLTNALKFTQKGEIAVTIRMQAEESGGYIEIAVSDTGIGIERQDQEIIFEEFRQLDGSSTRRYGGTGMGLSLCKKLAQSLGGNIQVNSEIGMGSVFSLLLPLRPPVTQPLGVG